MFLLLIGIFIIFAGGTLSIFFPEKKKPYIFSFFYIIATCLIAYYAFSNLISNSYHSLVFTMPFPIGEVFFSTDALSLFFILFIVIMGLPGILYSIGYLKPYIGKKESISSHYFFLGIFFTAIILITLVENALAFLIIWEIMSLSSFFLVIFENKKEDTLSAGINYLIMMHISVLFLVIGFLSLSLLSGSYNFSNFATLLQNNKYIANILFIIFFIGFGIKSGFIPFHTWLPKAHPAAPSHVSGIMSGVMIKIGIYGILRILLLIKTPSLLISYAVLIISTFSALYGVLYAIAQHDLKKLLAYHSIENIGIIGMGIGVGMLGLSYGNSVVAFLGFAGAILHVLNHSIFKELLFFGAGSIYNKTHTRQIDKFGGLIKKMPFTGMMFLIGSIAITGLPPFNGFVSEFLIYMGLIEGAKIHSLALLIVFVIVMGSLALVGTMALLCFSKVFGIVFLGQSRTEAGSNIDKDVNGSMLYAKVLLTAMIVIIGVFPQLILRIIIVVTNIFLPTGNLFFLKSSSYKIMNTISLGALTFLLILIMVYFLRQVLMYKKSITKYKTWDCGYQAGNPRMQYTSHSYTEPFMEMLSNVFVKKSAITKPEGLFPSKGHFKVKLSDSLEFYTVKPITRTISNILGKFLWIQSGNTQLYILYGFIFLIIAIIGAFLFG